MNEIIVSNISAGTLKTICEKPKNALTRSRRTTASSSPCRRAQAAEFRWLCTPLVLPRSTSWCHFLGSQAERCRARSLCRQRSRASMARLRPRVHRARGPNAHEANRQPQRCPPLRAGWLFRSKGHQRGTTTTGHHMSPRHQPGLSWA